MKFCTYISECCVVSVYYCSMDDDVGVLLIVISVLTLRVLMSYIYGAPILDVSRSHTTTHHSR